MSDDDLPALIAATGDLEVSTAEGSKATAAAKSKATNADDSAPAPSADTIFKAASAVDVNSLSSVEELARYIKLQQYGKLKAEVEERERRQAQKAFNTSKEHKFWDTQPVKKLGELVEGQVNEPLDPNTDVEQVRKEPYKMPAGFDWCVIDVHDADELSELYTLLTENYVEDDSAMFRFDYSREFLLWALTVPGFYKDWHVGVRAAGKDGKKGKLMGCITGVPVEANVHGRTCIPMAEINFLCVHKKLREKRLSPVLIKEITRRVHLTGRWQAIYTAGVRLPGCNAVCRYFHRTISTQKLVDISFSYCPRGKTMKDHVKDLALPKKTKYVWRAMEDADVPQVTEMLNTYLLSLKLAQHFSEEEVRHLMLPRDGVMCSFVIAQSDGKVSDYCSFYHLPSSIMKHDTHKLLRAVYSYYNVATSIPFVELMQDMLVMAEAEGADVMNALDLMCNEPVFAPLKFGAGDGNLHYYTYNWKCAEVASSEVGLVLV